jgi:hypothetical protein
MNAFRTLGLAAVALATVAIATPAQAHERRYRHRHVHGRVIIYDTPRYGYAPRYYRPYGERIYTYDRAPSVTFAFGGHRDRDRDYHHRR